MSTFILAIDQGTTSSRAIVFDRNFHKVAIAQQEFPQHFPRSGWVEHDPEDIWNTTLATCRQALAAAGIEARALAGIGITNQRETTLVWDAATGQPVYRAIVWQDRRAASYCESLLAQGHGPVVAEKTGLRIDSYFSASKINWILDTVPGTRAKAEAGQLRFGTVDSYLLWRLTGGRIHATDASNASRTMLYNIHQHRWDEELLRIFTVPAAMLPEVKDSADDYGQTDADIFGVAVPVRGIAGDQQAALVGQACFQPGMIKSTYGTGCFMVLNTGREPVVSHNQLLTTVGYRLRGITTYALEGSIFVAGAAVQWLRDAMGIVDSAAETGTLAAQADSNQDVYLVPAFTGLGAPHWDANARGAIYGITRATGPAELSRAALESVCYQTRDLLEAMRGDWPGMADTVLRVDGGMTASDFTMQFLSDIINAPVDRPTVLETTAVGAAYLAGLQAGLYPEPDGFARSWQAERHFRPALDEATRQRKYQGWQEAVRRTLSR